MFGKRSRIESIDLLPLDGSLDGSVRIRVQGWDIGEIFVASRGSFVALCTKGALEEPGIYLAIAKGRIKRFGNSANLPRLIDAGEIEACGTDRIVILTSEHVLDAHDMEQVESRIAEALVAGGVDAAWDGHIEQMRRYERVRGPVLERYLDGALAVLRFIGVSMTATVPHITGGGVSDGQVVSNIRPIRSARIGKRVAVGYLRDHGIAIGEQVNISTLSPEGAFYWVNPRTTMLSCDWNLILNDNKSFVFTVLCIPARTLCMRDEAKGGEGLIRRRDKPQYIDLYLEPHTLKDRRSGIDFSRFVIGKITY